MEPTWISDCGTVRLWLAKHELVLPSLTGFDCIVTDPPYGIDYGNAGGFCASHGWGKWRENVAWDKERPPQSSFELMLSKGVPTVIWGGNYFTDYLTPTGKWLIWDKGQTDFSLADCEVAWCSWQGAMRRLVYPRSHALKDGKIHPTQKPVALMQWCFLQLPKDCKRVLDCYFGSGTTAIAAIRSGIGFDGCEENEAYFEAAKARISDELIKRTGNYKANPAKYPLLALEGDA